MNASSSNPSIVSITTTNESLCLPARDQVIDMHCHAAGIGAGNSGCFVSSRLERSFRFRFYLKSFGVTEAELKQKGDGLVIARIAERVAESQRVGRAVVLAMDGVISRDGILDTEQTEVYIPNEFLAKETAKHPNLLFGASVNPYRRDALEQLEWCRSHGAVLLKWLPAIQQIDPADRQLIPFYRRLAELQLPLLTHTGTERSFTRANDELSDPARLRLALQCGATVIAAHVATGGSHDGERAIDRLARLASEFPHLYADISALTQPNKMRYLNEVMHRPEFRGRLLYGTDYPLTAIRLLVSPWYHVRRLGLRRAQQVNQCSNSWDRDVALKQAIHFPSDVWTRARNVLALPSTAYVDGPSSKTTAYS